jgi:protein TonB
MSDSEPVHAPLAAPTYLTHVTVPVFRRGRALGVAAVVHLAAFAVLVLVFNHRFRALQPDEATLSLVIEPSPFVGSGPTVITPVSKPAPRPMKPQTLPPQPEKTVPTPSTATQTGAEVAHVTSAAASLPLPAPPAPAAPKPSPPKLAVPIQRANPHLGDNQPVGYGLVVDNRILPARPDARMNRPPPYPPLARSHGEQGKVLLSIQVAPTGRASAVTIVKSSGYLILDNAARDAAFGWRFLPAQYHGKVVPASFLLLVKFELSATADH